MSEIKLFNKWDTSKIKINDPGLNGYIGLKPVIIPKTHGRHRKQFYKSEISIVERLINHLYIPGHRGKKHLRSSGRCSGDTMSCLEITKDAFEIIEKKTKMNPVEVLVRAIENAALREEITSFQLGGITARKAVIASPQRRIDLALRLLVQASYQKATKGGKPMAPVLAEEILATYKNDASSSHAIREKERIEREAAGAR